MSTHTPIFSPNAALSSPEIQGLFQADGVLNKQCREQLQNHRAAREVDSTNGSRAYPQRVSDALDYKHFEGGVDGCATERAQSAYGLLQLLRTRLVHANVATGDDDVVLGRVQAQHAQRLLRIIGVGRGCRR